MKPRTVNILNGVSLLVLVASLLVWVGPLLIHELSLYNEDDGEDPGDELPAASSDSKAVSPSQRLLATDAVDQDDVAIWIHPKDPSQSTIIASDKRANKVFVYDFEGKVLQSIPVPHPGNIDVRYGFPLHGSSVDIVAFNTPSESRFRVYQVVPATRQLERVDNGEIHTGAKTIGGTLYRSPKTGRYYFVATTIKSDADTEQFELADDGTGKVGARKVRNWRIGPAEGAVADDESGNLYIAEKRRGVWELGGDPTDSTPGRLIIERGQNGLGHIEGLALYHLSAEDDYLIVSNQERSDFKLYRRVAPHQFVGTFAVTGAKHTDGLDVCNANLGPRFPNGILVCHTGSRLGSKGRPMLITPWESIVERIPEKLTIDTQWDWRHRLAQFSPTVVGPQR